MKKVSKQISRRVFLSTLGVVSWFTVTFGQSLVTFSKSKLSIQTSTGLSSFSVEMAITQQQQSQGLMYRRSMAPDTGMLFDYRIPQSIQMWMRNTLIPLDMIFIDQNGKVINIKERAIPLSETIIESDGKVRAVLELNGGTASRLGIRPGDKIFHKIFMHNK
jgi:uncharacterized membrane protein (UPF0127 family)